LPPATQPTWKELINAFAAFYAEFADKIRTEWPDPRVAVEPVVISDNGAGTKPVFRQKGT
jgi:hypothetical protein